METTFSLKTALNDLLEDSKKIHLENFDLRGGGTLITIRPKTRSWKFLLDFYQKSEFTTRRKKIGEISLLGTDESKKRSISPVLYVQNFPDEIEDKNRASYFWTKEFPIQLFIQPIPEQNLLFISLRFGDQIFNRDVHFPLGESYLKIGLETVSDSSEIVVAVKQATPVERKKTPIPFRVGNVIFRLGDAADYDVLLKADRLVLPAAAEGRTTDYVKQIASEFHISPPTPGIPGTLSVYKTHRGNEPFEVFYAFSIAQSKSSFQIITSLCKALEKTSRSRKERKAISLPLLGTGAGALDAIDVADIYIKEFSSLGHIVFVNIKDEDIFQSLLRHFSESIMPMPFLFLKQKPMIILELEEKIGTELYPENFSVIDGKITDLSLAKITLLDSRFLVELESLNALHIAHSKLNSLFHLQSLTNLRILRLNDCTIKDFSPIFECHSLNVLDLSGSNFINLEPIAALTNLRALYLKSNGIYDIEALGSCQAIETLDLAANEIYDCNVLTKLTKLRNLNLSRNFLNSLSFVTKLKDLELLNVSHNRISDARPILKCHLLAHLSISNNPLEQEYDLKISDYENHLVTVRNFLLRQEETNKKAITFPVKVLLLGNHASGKSSLLHYFQNKSFDSKITSTHIIKIEHYPKVNNNFPKAIFFDFGGQDYYHGIYRAFLSGESIYLLLWQTTSNENRQSKDSRGVLTQDFKLDYWIHQKRYLENEKFLTNDPLVLIQTHADRDQKNLPGCLTDCAELKDEFHVSLKPAAVKNKTYNGTTVKNFYALEHLQATVDELIEEKRTTKKEPQWYIDFIDYILNSGTTADYHSTPITEIITYYERDEEENLAYLKDDLDQLHKHGLILYYAKDIPDKVWMNPAAVVQYIHDKVLGTSLLHKSVKGEIRASDMHIIDPDIIQLLSNQKVIFYHEQNDKYIIPNYLPLANDGDSDFDLMTFGLGDPMFTLKFKHFIPFGLINQIICAFGVLPDKKRFWRDQLLFTLEGSVKILIKLDFALLEIKVYAHFFNQIKNWNREEYIRYLFYGLLATYWDMQLLSFSEFKLFHAKRLALEQFDINDPMFTKINQAMNLYDNNNCQPIDLYLSVDDQHFIEYTTLCQLENEAMIPCYLLDEQRNLSLQQKSRYVYPFQSFTLKELKKPRKAVISYSKKDIALVEKFRQYLVPLADDGLMQNPWYCSELIAGSAWDDTIQEKFNDADIIFFMVSENLMATPYVKENEIKNAIDRWNRDQSIMIVPIILVPYHWARTGPYNLADFTALPYTAYPISSFEDQNLAWDYVSEAIRIMLLNNIYPGSESFRLSNDMIQFFEKVMAYRKGESKT